MKILHTSDWHLGKRLEGKSRLAEQEEALDSLIDAAANVHADVVAVAGDIFDTVNPPADAESLFYEKCLRLSRICPVIAIAGNHDNPDRLSAPDGIARECGILLGGSLDFSGAKDPFCGGEGFVTLCKNGERVNFALLPYPSEARMSQLGYATDKKDYAENVRDWLSLCARSFRASDCNVIVSHLFMAGSERVGDEIELGAARLLPLSVLPDAHYTALGHVHKPQCVNRKTNVYYSGSLLRYSFDDVSDKYFNLVTTTAAGVASVEKIPVAAGKKLVTKTVHGYDEAAAVLRENEGGYVRLLYDCAQPLSASRYAELRAFDSYCALHNVYRMPKAEHAAPALLSDGELFAAFYKEAHDGKAPSEKLTELFERAMRGEEL